VTFLIFPLLSGEWFMAFDPLLTRLRQLELPNGFRYVCSLYTRCKICSNQHPLPFNIVYWEGRSLRLFLVLNIDCKVLYVIVTNDFTIFDFVGDANQENVVKFLVEGDEDRLKKILARARKTKLHYLLKVLNEAESQKTIYVADQHLYGYLKTLLTLNQII